MAKTQLDGELGSWCHLAIENIVYGVDLRQYQPLMRFRRAMNLLLNDLAHEVAVQVQERSREAAGERELLGD